MIEHCTVREFCRRHGIGRSTFYKRVAPHLRIVKIGTRTLIPSDSERAWCESLRPGLRPPASTDIYGS